jgi:hypothetical protein
MRNPITSSIRITDAANPDFRLSAKEEEEEVCVVFIVNVNC